MEIGKRNRVKTDKLRELEETNAQKEEQKRQIAAEALLLFNPPEETPVSSQGVPYKLSTGNIDLTAVSMTKLINQLYGEDMVSKWKNSSKRPRYGRHAYEISSATTQCMNTIGRAEDSGGCWICGFAFNDEIPYMRPNCDHILPVAQAVFFLGLYSTRKVIPNEMPELKDTIYKLEYAWAHGACNILKSNINFIQEKIDPVHKTPIWTVNQENIDYLLKNIQSTKTADLSAIVSQITNPKKWFDARRKDVYERVEKITNFISRPAEPGLGDLTVLAGWSSLVDPTSMTDEFLDFINVSLPPNVIATSRRKRTLSDTESDPPAKRMKMVGTRRRNRRYRKTLKNRRHK
jgi:hypothetical protein